ncbi:MAG: tRNA (adenosine(37)-N6)-dimethylallyltransferase MiaA [bacterium]
MGASNASYIIAIVGPTAVGKSAVAVELAERLNGEVLSVDSMQVYRGLDIGTAKPGPELRTRVPHHLLDLVDPWEEFNASRFADEAEKVLVDVLGRGRVPVLCGGTGLYFRALLEGFFDAPAPAREIRERLESEYRSKGLDPLRERLRAFDPEWADQVYEQDARRIIRALEIIETTGKRPSDLKEHQRPKEWIDRTLFIGLNVPTDVLDRRIEERTDWMIRNGLLGEAGWLLEHGGGSRTVRQAIGYKEIFPHLRGEITLDEARNDLITATKRLARRQMTWFRHQVQVAWIDSGSADTVEKKARKFLAFKD